MKQKLLVILFLVLTTGAFSQNVDINLPNDSVPFQMKATDRYGRETGFFQYNHLTGRITMRGNQKVLFGVFTATFLIPNWSIWQASQEVFKQLNVDGTIKDQVLYDAAMAEYLRIKTKYRM